MTDVKMPAYGISELGGTITQWLKDEGDSVKEGEPIVVVETEKADVELEAPSSGILKQICAANGDHVEVGASLAVIEDEAGVLDKARHVHKAESSKSEEPEVSSRQEPGPGRLLAEPPADRAPGQPMTEPPIKASPSARRLAKHHGIDLSGVKGTGPRGRIVLSDVQALVTATQSKKVPETELIGRDEEVKREDLSPVRQVIAERMSESARSIPHFHLTVDVDANGILLSQKRFGKAGTKVSITSILVKIVAETLSSYPRLNSSWRKDHIEIYKSVHMNVAVATDRGLFAPVIRDVTSKTIPEIDGLLKDLASRTREGSIRPEDLTGGTFTLTNLGPHGIREFNAIINPPQCSILAVGAITERPFVHQGLLGSRPELTLTLGSDHRVVDGAEAAQFLDALRQQLEKAQLQ